MRGSPMIINGTEKLIDHGFMCPYCGEMRDIIRLSPRYETIGNVFKKRIRIQECKCSICKQVWEISRKRV